MLGAFGQFMRGCVHDVEKADSRSTAENYKFDVVFLGFETGGRVEGGCPRGRRRRGQMQRSKRACTKEVDRLAGVVKSAAKRLVGSRS